MNADFVGHFADGFAFLRAGFRREIVVEIVVEFDAIEARVFGELHTLLQIHALGVGEGPEVDRLLHVEFARRSAALVGLARDWLGGARGCGRKRRGTDRGKGGLERGAAREGVARVRREWVCGRVRGGLRVSGGGGESGE